MLFFFSFIIATLLLGSIMIGPLSIRVYMTCIMIFVLLFDNLKKTINCNYIKIDSSFIKFYVAFLIVMGLSQLFNGDFIEYEYVKKLLAYHLVSIVLFLAIQRYINTYRDLQNIILLVSTILLINNITIFRIFFWLGLWSNVWRYSI